MRHKAFRAPAASGDGNAQPARASTIPLEGSFPAKYPGQMAFSPFLPVPAIHRGQPPAVKVPVSVFVAHRAANLLHCGR